MLTTAQRVLFGAGLLVGAALGIPAGTLMAAGASAEPLTACAEEDGNPTVSPARGRTPTRAARSSLTLPTTEDDVPMSDHSSPQAAPTEGAASPRLRRSDWSKQ